MSNKNSLLQKVSRLGLPMMETTEEFDTAQTLADVVKSRDPRLWEGFPVLLMNAAKDYNFNSDEVNLHLDSETSRNAYRDLVVLSEALYEVYHLQSLWTKKLKNSFTQEEKSRVKEFRMFLSHSNSFALAGMEFSSTRLKEMFNRYYESDAANNQNNKVRLEALSLEYALSQLFSPKQKELFKKKLEGQPLTKTEKEYFSRSVKKKVVALANPDLHRLAQKLLEG
jgi:hypothetical protein